MDVIHRVAKEATSECVANAIVGPKPHIRLVTSHPASMDRSQVMKERDLIQDQDKENFTLAKSMPIENVAELSDSKSRAKDEKGTDIDLLLLQTNEVVIEEPHTKLVIDEAGWVSSPEFAGNNTQTLPIDPDLLAPKLRKVAANHRFRAADNDSGERLASPIFAASAIVLVVVIAVGYLSLRLRGTPSLTKSLPTVTSVAKKNNSHVRSTPVTVPSFITPFQTNAAGASIAVSMTTYTVTLVASKPCWVAQSVSPNGVISWDAVLQPGQSRVITTTGSLWLRTGNSTAVTLTVNNVPVHFSSTPGAFNFLFVPETGSPA